MADKRDREWPDAFDVYETFIYVCATCIVGIMVFVIGWAIVQSAGWWMIKLLAGIGGVIGACWLISFLELNWWRRDSGS